MSAAAMRMASSTIIDHSNAFLFLGDSIGPSVGWDSESFFADLVMKKVMADMSIIMVITTVRNVQRSMILVG